MHTPDQVIIHFNDRLDSKSQAMIQYAVRRICPDAYCRAGHKPTKANPTGRPGYVAVKAGTYISDVLKWELLGTAVGTKKRIARDMSTGKIKRPVESAQAQAQAQAVGTDAQEWRSQW
jgi:hypothetical protein